MNNNEKGKSKDFKEYSFKPSSEMSNSDKISSNINMEASDRRNKNSNKDIPIHHPLTTEKENLDLEKMQANFMKTSANRYFVDNLR